MKRQLALVFAVSLVLAAGAATPKSLKVLMIGNSFSICVQKQMPQVAKAMGLELDLASLYIGGCSLERHWQNVVAATNAAFRPYRYTRFVNGEERPGGTANIPDALAAESWDVVTLQQGSHFSWKPETYRPFFGELVKTIRKICPRAEIVVQETWSYTPWDRRLAKWGIDQNQMYAELHRAYQDVAAEFGFRVIPMGTAVQIYRKRLPVVYTENSFGGDAVGSAKFVLGPDGKWTPKGDVFHLGFRGEYLQALVWTAKLFDVNVAQCPYTPADIPAAEATCLKLSAQAAVDGEPAK